MSNMDLYTYMILNADESSQNIDLKDSGKRLLQKNFYSILRSKQ